MASTNVFVLGGTGFVGSAFVRAARKLRYSVRAITRDNYHAYCGKSCDLLINANGNSRKFLANNEPVEDFDASTRSVLQSLVDFRAERYVYLSTIDVYPHVGDPHRNRESAVILPDQISRYGLHKYLAEQIVKKYASHWMIIRLGGMVGSGLWKNVIFDILHNRPLWAHVTSQYQFLNTDDAARVVFELIRRQPKSDLFNVCGKGRVSLAQVISWVPRYTLRYANRTPRIEHYEVNLTKTSTYVSLPVSLVSVRDFIHLAHKT
jgi:nucleoside-diphosphate-sugar epimerase